MRSDVHEKLNDITRQVDQLRVLAEESVEAIDTAAQRHEDMQKELWQQRKELTTLSRSAEAIAKLEVDNQNLRNRISTLRETLHGLLRNVKSLRNEFRT